MLRLLWARPMRVHLRLCDHASSRETSACFSRQGTREAAAARTEALPPAPAQQEAELESRGYQAWVKARQESDFSQFAPVLEVGWLAGSLGGRPIKGCSTEQNREQHSFCFAFAGRVWAPCGLQPRRQGCGGGMEVQQGHRAEGRGCRGRAAAAGALDEGDVCAL